MYLKVALQILQYARGTSWLGVTFQRGEGLQLDVSADVNHACKATCRRSALGAWLCAKVQQLADFLGRKSASRFQPQK